MNSKTFLLSILFSFTLPGALTAVEQPLDPKAEYAKAVKTYVDAAGAHLQAVRDNVDAYLKDGTDETKARFRTTLEALAQAEKVLTQLKNAIPADFDRVKAEFERTREKLLKEWTAAQKG